MASDDDFRQQLAELSARVASLEATVAESASAARGCVPPAERRPAQGCLLKAQAAGAKPGASLESRIGAQLLNRIGILAVLIGVAWFLKLAFDRNWIGPPVRDLDRPGRVPPAWWPGQSAFAAGDSPPFLTA